MQPPSVGMFMQSPPPPPPQQQSRSASPQPPSAPPRPSPQPSPRPSPQPSPRPMPNQAPRPSPQPSPRPMPNQAPRPSPQPSPRPMSNQVPRPIPNQAPRPIPNQAPRPMPNQMPLSSQPVYSVPHANAWDGLSSANNSSVQRFEATFLTRPFGFECDSTLRVIAVEDDTAASRANMPVGAIVETIGGQGARFNDLSTCPLPAVITFSYNPNDARNQQIQVNVQGAQENGVAGEQQMLEKQQPMPRTGEFNVQPGKRSSAAETTLKAVRRALDFEMRMNPNPLQEEIRMHAVYFSIIAAFLFSMFICSVVGIASTMTVTPSSGSSGEELRWSQNGLRVCAGGSCGDTLTDAAFSTLCYANFVETVSEGDCGRIMDHSSGSLTAGGFVIFFVLCAALIMGFGAYRYLKGTATLLAIPHQLFALIMGICWLVSVSTFAVWADQVHNTIKNDLVFSGEAEDGDVVPEFSGSSFAAGYAAWVAGWLCNTIIIFAEFCQWWRQKEPVNSPDWLECAWLPFPFLPRSIGAKS